MENDEIKKLDMKSADIVDSNIEKVGTLFPNCITETENGLKVDYDLLKQELSNDIVEGNTEKYQLTWPGKKESILEANRPINKTLRPIKEKSVDFDKTENIYIEGDNLEALKILQNSYLNKIKCIYIDPPYNTGNDFIYNDNYSKTSEQELEESGQIDEYNNRLVTNNESNGRFHSDWLKMMYPRLKLARNLLTNDGVIFISIDDNEQDNLKKICDEIFGEGNFIGIITWGKKRKGSFLTKKIVSLTEYCMVYSKNSNNTILFGGNADSSESQPIIKRTNPISILHFKKDTVKSNLPDGIYKCGKYGENINPVELMNEINIINGVIKNNFSLKGHFIWTQKYLENELNKGSKIVINTKNMQPRVFRVQNDNSFKGLESYINGISIKGTNEDSYEELERIFGIKKIFDYSKPANYIQKLLEASTHFDKDAIIMDFFSGSGTTAQAIMELNQKDNGNRKFVLVQIPEKCNQNTEANKNGYQTICNLGEERIRRVAKKIQEETNADIDYGFRVYKVDSSNMKDVYYEPSKLGQEQLNMFESNIKEDRTPEDLLTQVMLDLGLTLDLSIEEKKIIDNKVYFVAGNSLVACFDNKINIDILNEICKTKPLKVVFRESSFNNDSEKINAYERIKKLSPETEISVI